MLAADLNILVCCGWRFNCILHYAHHTAAARPAVNNITDVFAAARGSAASSDCNDAPLQFTPLHAEIRSSKKCPIGIGVEGARVHVTHNKPFVHNPLTERRKKM